MSNALKFSPEGGEVIVNVFFEPVPLLITKGKRSSVTSVITKDEKAVKSNKSVMSASVGGLRRSLSMMFSKRHSHAGSPHAPADDASVATPPTAIEPVAKLGRLVVTVTDTGPGISAENQKRLFKEVIQVR